MPTARPARSVIKRHKATFDHYGKKIRYYFWSNTPDHTLIDTVIFLGTAQVGRIPAWVAAVAPFGVIVVQGLPHWRSKSAGEDTQEFYRMYASQSFETVLETFQLKRVHLIAESQAAPAVMLMAGQFPARIANVALVLPLGLNSRHFGDDDNMRFLELKRRSLKSALHRDQSPLRDIRNLYAALSVARFLIASIRDGSIRRKYAIGVAQDLLEDLRQLLERQRLEGRYTTTLFLGDQDVLFPPHEILAALDGANITGVKIEIVQNKSHGSLATKAAAPLVRRVVKAVRETTKVD